MAQAWPAAMWMEMGGAIFIFAASRMGIAYTGTLAGGSLRISLNRREWHAPTNTRPEPFSPMWMAMAAWICWSMALGPAHAFFSTTAKDVSTKLPPADWFANSQPPPWHWRT